jgi:hypothetical protein
VRALAALEGFALLIGAIGLAGCAVAFSFIAYLAALHWSWLALVAVCAVGAIASVVVGLNLLFRPSTAQMLSGLVLLVPGLLSFARWKGF